MKNTSAVFLIVSALATATAPLRADPIEEIDLTSVDDSAEERAKAPKVSRTPDGYLDVMCDDATLSSVLKQFRRVTRMNILSSTSSNLERRVSASLSHVPWQSALQSLLGLGNFKMDERDGIWYVSEKTPEEALNATRYFPIRHANAQDIADLFNGTKMETTYRERHAMTSSNKLDSDTTEIRKGLNSEQDDNSALKGLVKATAFADSNMLILTGTEVHLNMCEQIIKELDRPITQVYIEARFIELSTAAMHKLGVKWNQLESWGATVHGVKAGYVSNAGTPADYGTVTSQKTTNNNLTEGKNSTAADSLNTSLTGDGENTTSESLASNKSVNDNDNYNKTTSDNSTLKGLVPDALTNPIDWGDDTSNDMGWRNASAFAGQLSADDFRLALSAFEQIKEGTIFSNPRIIVANGKKAYVDMTTKDPYIEVKSDRSGTEGQNLSVSSQLQQIPGQVGDKKNPFAGQVFFSYGISLEVLPLVSSSGLISIEILPTISFRDTDQDDGVNIINGYKIIGQNSYPLIRMKSINTAFTMKDGATAIIGGLTRTEETDVDSGIPYLRKIPWIGPKLFGWKSREKVQSEILVCVTVGIANPETLRKDAGLPTNAVLGREYVEGRRFEPGERPNALKNITSIDTRTLDEIRADPYQLKDDDAFGEEAKKEESKAKEEESKAKTEAKEEAEAAAARAKAEQEAKAEAEAEAAAARAKAEQEAKAEAEAAAARAKAEQEAKAKAEAEAAAAEKAETEPEISVTEASDVGGAAQNRSNRRH